jgi:hypothetical protein
MRNDEYENLKKKKESVSESLFSRNVTLPLNFSIRKKILKEKREKTFKFSNIPEEEALAETQEKRNRPSNLPLKLKKFRPEMGKISFGEYDSYSDFIGKTSVCCTPLTENKIFCGPVGSIFSENDTKIEKKIEEKPSKAPAFRPVIIQYYNNPLKSIIKKSWSDLSTLEDDIDDFDMRKNYNTICDANYPFFDERRRPMSKSLFDLFGIVPETTEKSKVRNLFIPVTSEKPIEIVKKPEHTIIQESQVNKPSIMQRKKMMRLPIKSITSTALENDSGRPSTSSISDASTFDSPKSRKYSLQLTPLMAKLTSLALLDNDLTPNFTPVDILSKKITSASAIKTSQNEDIRITNFINQDMKKLDLLIYQQHNTKLIVLGEANFFHENETIVQSIFELCNNRLGKLEQKINNLADATATNEVKNNDYSFMNINQLWDIKQRCGSFNYSDIHNVHLINEFFNRKTFSDVILYDGNEGGLLYGSTKSDESEVYYKCNSQKVHGGLPAPFTDFDIVKVRKLLERDHSMVLF